MKDVIGLVLSVACPTCKGSVGYACGAGNGIACPDRIRLALNDITIACGSCRGLRARDVETCPHCPPGHNPATCCRCWTKQ